MAGPVCCYLNPPPNSMLPSRGFDAATCQQYATGALAPPPNWTMTFVNSPMCTGIFPQQPAAGGVVTGFAPTSPTTPTVMPSGPPPAPSPPSPGSYAGVPLAQASTVSPSPATYSVATPIAATSPVAVPTPLSAPTTGGSGGTGAPSSPSGAGTAGLAPSPSSQPVGQLMLCQPLPAGTQF